LRPGLQGLVGNVGLGAQRLPGSALRLLDPDHLRGQAGPLLLVLRPVLGAWCEV